MGGVNPYQQQARVSVAARPFSILIRNSGQKLEIDPAQLPYGRDGLPGSLLDILLHHRLDVDHACGGVVACSTCHLVVHKGLSSCSAATEAEEDMLDTAPGLTPQSRLACQCVPDGSTDLEIEIPSWNRNQVRE